MSSVTGVPNTIGQPFAFIDTPASSSANLFERAINCLTIPLDFLNLPEHCYKIFSQIFEGSESIHKEIEGHNFFEYIMRFSNTIEIKSLFGLIQNYIEVNSYTEAVQNALESYSRSEQEKAESQSDNEKAIKALMGLSISDKHSMLKEIICAFDEGDLERVIDLCEIFKNNDENFNLLKLAIFRNDKGETLLHKACKVKNNTKEIINFLFRCCALLNIEDVDGVTPLHAAANAGNDVAIELLVKRGAKINKVDHYGRNALHFAACSMEYEKAKLLVTNATVNAQDQLGNTPLHVAILHGNLGMVEGLLTNENVDVNLDLANTGNLNPLQLAELIAAAAREMLNTDQERANKILDIIQRATNQRELATAMDCEAAN